MLCLGWGFLIAGMESATIHLCNILHTEEDHSADRREQSVNTNPAVAHTAYSDLPLTRKIKDYHKTV